MKPTRLLAMILVVLATACTSAEDSLDGQVIYANNCSRCHGVDLGGRQGVALDGDSEAAGKPDVDYIAAIRSGPGIMPRFEGLSDGQVTAVIAYLRQLQGG